MSCPLLPLTGTVDSSTTFPAGDVRGTIPRFSAQNRTANQELLDQVLLSHGRKTPHQLR